MTGVIRAWIEIGAPDAARLHRAAKIAPRVAVYCHKPIEHLRRQLEGQDIHRRDAIALFAVDRPLVAALASRLDRRAIWTVTVSGGEVYIGVGAETLTGTMARVTLP
jgi:uncharacterized protein YaeQ